jgi:hypothetical protein
MGSTVLYPRSVEVFIHKEDGADVIGSINARHGLPVELRLTRDKNTTVVRLSIEEALAVAITITNTLPKE